MVKRLVAARQPIGEARREMRLAPREDWCYARAMAARPDTTQTDLPSARRPGTYVRGTETVDAILKAALSVLIEEGAGAFTVRRIAAECGMKVGNVSYHFPKKELLIQTLLDDIIANYDKLLERTVRQPGLDAEERLRLIVVMCLDDIAGKRTTPLSALPANAAWHCQWSCPSAMTPPSACAPS